MGSRINDNFLANIGSYEDIADHKRKYLDSKGIKFNPEKFIRKREAMRALGIVYYSMPAEDRTPEIEEFYKKAKEQLDDVETLSREINRRIKEDNEHKDNIDLSKWR